MITPFTLALAFLIISVLAMSMFSGSLVAVLPVAHFGGM